MNLEYFFQWDNIVILITVLISILILFTGIYLCFKKRYIIGGLINISIIIITGVYMPRKTVITNKQITICLLLRSIEIPATEIINIQTISPQEINNSIRVFGSGGYFGYLGKFKNDKQGAYILYATEKNNLMLIQTLTHNYIVSSIPEQEITVIKALLNLIK